MISITGIELLLMIVVTIICSGCISWLYCDLRCQAKICKELEEAKKNIKD